MIAVLFTTVVNAQNSKVVTASSALFNEEYAKAKEAIDEAILNEKQWVRQKPGFIGDRFIIELQWIPQGNFQTWPIR